MMPENETDRKAEAWFNGHMDFLRYHQDYTLCFGHSEKIMEGDKQTGLSIRRPYIRIFSTGMTKLYRMIVLGETLDKVEYTEEQEEELNRAIEKAEALHDKMGKKS